MSVQYKTNVEWDSSLRDLELANASASMPSAMQGLVVRCLKVTTGAPAATAGKFIKGARITNSFDGTLYANTGTTASPVWTLISGGQSHVIKFAGTATGGTTATRAYTITGALSTDVVTAVIRASTNAASIQKATLTANTLTVLFSTDPGASTTVDYTIVRAV